MEDEPDLYRELPNNGNGPEPTDPPRAEWVRFKDRKLGWGARVWSSEDLTGSVVRLSRRNGSSRRVRLTKLETRYVGPTKPALYVVEEIER